MILGPRTPPDEDLVIEALAALRVWSAGEGLRKVTLAEAGVSARPARESEQRQDNRDDWDTG